MSARTSSPGILDAVRADFREFLSTQPPADPSLDFEQYCAAKTALLTRCATATAFVAVVIFEPTDFFIYGFGSELFYKMVAFRFFAMILMATGYVSMRRELATQPYMPGRVSRWYLVTNAYVLGFMGYMAGPASAPFASAAFIFPIISTGFLLELGPRIRVNLGAAAIAMLAYFAPHPAYWSYPYNGFVIVNLILSAATSVVVGGLYFSAERTGFDQRRKLREHAGRLEELNKMKDAFVATVSHELRTPLNAILGFADVVMDAPIDAESRKQVGIIRKSGESLLNLINDILDMAKLRAGKFPLVNETVSLRLLVDGCVEMFSVTCRDRGLTLTAVVPEDVPAVIGDKARLNQILVNLVGNAVKFTSSGEIRIEVACEPTEEHHGNLTLAVRDTGPGIPADQRESVFEEFTQVDTSTTREFGGTGLGLPIVRRLAGLMGGNVTIADNTPHGTVFTVHLPVQFAPVSPTSIPGRPRSAPQPTRPTRRILIVDDVVENRQVIEAFLHGQRVQLEQASDGMEGVERFTAGQFDLVLLDIEMPRMDGYQAIKEMREWESHTGREPTSIVALTAHGTLNHRIRTMEAGFTGHLVKPVRKQEFLQAVDDYSTTPSSREKQPEEPESAASQVDEAEADAMLRALRPGYLMRRREELGQVNEFLGARQYEQIRRIGHNLKGTGGSYGMAEISDIGKEMEEAARQENETAIRALLGKLESTIGRYSGLP